MPPPYWFCLAVLFSVPGCGRLGVQLYRLDVDASMQPMDAGTSRDAGQLSAAGRMGAGGSSSGSGAGAAADSGIDAGLPYQGDASLMGMLDAGIATPVDAGNPTTCGGALQFDLCWYLAAEDTHCNDECADKGGFDTRAPNYIGTESQGGNEQSCQQVLTALGRPGTVAVGTQQVGLGCHIWNNGDRWWLQSPAFNANASTPNGTGARIVCACQN